AKGTLPNRLFLTECRERNVGENVRAARDIINVLSWFEDGLIIIFPTTMAAGLVSSVYINQDFQREVSRYLRCFDTGMEAIDAENVELEKVSLPDDARHRVESEVQKSSRAIVGMPDGEFLVYERDPQGTLRVWKLVARHRGRNGAKSRATFDMVEESDGTRRLMHLVPAMMGLMSSNHLYVIDELDRSLHPEVLHSYLSNFLTYSAGRRSQLIVTTHDTTLLKQRFLRRDEIWFVEKGPDQSSRLIALEEFKNADRSKDLQQDYLLGRFGGVPVIRDFSWLGEGHG